MAKPQDRSPTVSISLLSVPSSFYESNLLKRVSMNTVRKAAVKSVLSRIANLNLASFVESLTKVEFVALKIVMTVVFFKWLFHALRHEIGW